MVEEKKDKGVYKIIIFIIEVGSCIFKESQVIFDEINIFEARKSFYQYVMWKV